MKIKILHSLYFFFYFGNSFLIGLIGTSENNVIHVEVTMTTSG